MPAHTVRRHFARSFVVTLAAALPACDHAEQQPIASNPPMPTETATASTAATPSALATTAPPATPPDRWSVMKDGNGKCSAEYDNDATCPPDTHCNPPPPTPYACPPNVTNFPVTVTKAAGATTCTTLYTVYGGGGNCPPGMMCNPPPPHQVTEDVPCPK